MEWKTEQLGNLITIKYGKDHKKLKDGPFPVYGSGGIMRFVDTAIYNKPSLLLPRKGSLNNIMFTDKPFWTVDTMFWSIIDESKIEPKFLYYAMCKKNLVALNVGTSVPSLTVPVLEDVSIPYPPIPIQRKIAGILSALDAKIENNNKINANLEAQAEALFKSWFVDFTPFKDQPFVDSELGPIPQGWKVEKINDLDLYITDFVSNGSFASLKQNVTLYSDENYAFFIRNTDLKEGRFRAYVDKSSYFFLKKSVLHGGEIIISNVGDVGSVNLCPKLNKPMTLGNNIIMLKSEDEATHNFLYILFKWSYGKSLINLNSATHIVRNKFKILSNNILPSILPCQKIHLT